MMNGQMDGYAYWLASPAGNDWDYLFSVLYNGSIEQTNYADGAAGFRPVICLKSGIQLVEQESGKYAILFMR